MGTGPTLQIKEGRGGFSPTQKRAFNPQRDMVWGMGRLVKRLGKRLAERLHNENGEIDEQAYMLLLREHAIYAPKGLEQANVKNFVDFVKVINEYFQKLHADMDGAPIDKPPAVMYKGDQFAAARALFSVLFMQELFAEHPFWWQQVKPSSKTDPRPDVQEIDEAARTILGSI